MCLFRRLALMLAVLCTLFVDIQHVKAEPLSLTEDEQAWIAENGVVSIGVVADNEPYSFYLNGNVLGWTIDVIDQISIMTGLDLKPRLGSWPEIYGQFRLGGLDVIADISETEPRSRFIRFTAPYHMRRTVVFENVDHPVESPGDIEELKTKRVGIISDIYYADALREAGIEPVGYATYRDLMAAVAFGWVDLALAAEMTGNFFVRENGFTNVIGTDSVPLAAMALEDFRLGVLRENDRNSQILFSILEKAVNALSAETLEETTERWLSYRTERVTAAGPLRLLPEEQAFVEDAPPLTIGFMTDYEPFSYLDSGRGRGLAVDISQFISSETGLTFRPVFDNWSKLLERFRSGELDVISNISYTDERAEYTLFSDLYHRIPNAVFVRSGFGPYLALADLDGKAIGISKDIYYAEAVHQRFDNVREFDSQEALLKALAGGTIDAAIASLSNGNAIIRHLGLINVEIGGEFMMDGVEREDLRFGVSPRYPYLQSIISRALQSIPAARWDEMERRWLGPPAARMPGEAAVLEPEERTYLDSRGVIRVCVEPTAPPYTMIKGQGELSGAIGGIVDLLAQRGRFSWQTAPLSSEIGQRAAASDNDCDLLPFAARRNLEGSEDYDLSPAYLSVALAVASPLQAPFVENLRDLRGERVGIVPSHVPYQLLQTRYPDVTLVEIGSEREGISDVLSGRLDAVVGPLDGLVYLITDMGTNDVKISGRIAEELEVVVASTADEPMLGRIVSKLLADLDPSTVQAILNREMLTPFKRAIDYRLLLVIAVIAFLVLGLSLFWVRKLRSLNKELNQVNGLLQEASITDNLTKLFNRGYFIEQAEEAFSRCREDACNFTLIMLDVDHFKPVNDRLGHLVGDTCLVHLADLLQAHFSANGDMVARYGGEEFIAFHVGDDARNSAAFLEQLRLGVAENPVDLAGARQSMTISIGFHTGVPQSNECLSDFIKHADSKLYEAKDQGRNRVNGNS